MGIKYIDLRDRTGRQSSIGLVDGGGTFHEGVLIVGVLAHWTEFSFDEFDRFARAYLEARADSGSAIDDAKGGDALELLRRMVNFYDEGREGDEVEERLHAEARVLLAGVKS